MIVLSPLILMNTRLESALSMSVDDDALSKCQLDEVKWFCDSRACCLVHGRC